MGIRETYKGFVAEEDREGIVVPVPSQETVIDKYLVHIPIDLGDQEEREQCAIHQASEEISQVFAIPCNWWIDQGESDGEYIAVRRERRSSGGFPEPEILEG